MTIWILRELLTPEEEAHIEERTHLTLPFEDLSDLSMVTSQVECRHLLQALHPDDPPETIARKTERIWRLYGGLRAEDIIAVPLNSRQELALAEITKKYHYEVGDGGSDVHQVVVKWHEKRVPWRSLRKHKDLLESRGEKLVEVTNPDARTIIRDRLPHSYNRFAKWKWILVLFFIMGLISVGSSRVDLQACKLEYSIVSPK